ncbi:uncharacterized protein LOC143258655 isoform X3 [Tachypleus tridentatus]|uniref:uncharacterized protein LOC143258655 isoform X3 n=1 Tax=Tachypleus tridentatus TaxID=6853 RepID=UPI003FD085BF
MTERSLVFEVLCSVLSSIFKALLSLNAVLELTSRLQPIVPRKFFLKAASGFLPMLNGLNYLLQEIMNVKSVTDALQPNLV